MKVRELSSITIKTGGQRQWLLRGSADTVSNESVVPLAQTSCLYFVPGAYSMAWNSPLLTALCGYCPVGVHSGAVAILV